MKKTILTSLTILTMITTTMAQNVPNYVPTNGLVGWWPFNGNANDESGNANNAVIHGNTLTQDRYGNANCAYDFNGTNNYMDLPNVIPVFEGTISYWFKTNGSSEGQVLVYHSNTIDNGWGTIHANAIENHTGIAKPDANTYQNSCVFDNGNGIYGNDTINNIAINQWYHVVVTYNVQDSARMYVNGNLVNTFDLSTETATNLPTMTYIGRPSMSTRYFNGVFDDFGIWNRALTQQEITNLYNGTLSNCNLITSATFTVPNNTLISPFGIVNYVSTPTFQYSMPLNLNQWHYVAISKDNNNQANVYLNGQLIFQGTYQNLSYNWNRLDLGAVYFTNFDGWFNGYIDEIRLSNTVRSATDILNSYNSNSPFTSDPNTIGLWHFDQNNGTIINAAIGTSGQLINAVWNAQGRFGQCMSFNGTNARAQILQSIPTYNMTFEFWIKPAGFQSSWPISWYGLYTAGFAIWNDTLTTNYTWSTGSTGNSITVDPSTLPYIWVTDGNCTDTVWFNSQSATIYDTSYVSVTDTLIINTSISGINPPNNVNTIKIYPNPASTHITIDYGNISLMNGYQLRIENSLGQMVFQTGIIQQVDYLNLSTWSGNGMYYVRIIDPQGNTIDIRKIVLQ